MTGVALSWVCVESVPEEANLKIFFYFKDVVYVNTNLHWVVFYNMIILGIYLVNKNVKMYECGANNIKVFTL